MGKAINFGLEGKTKARAHYNLGEAYLNSGNREAALAQHSLILALDPKMADDYLKQVIK